MNDTNKCRSFRYIMPSDKLALSLESLMYKITTMRNRVYRNAYVPLFISLNINSNGTQKDLVFIKALLKELRLVQQRYFVRFVTDLHWLEQSETQSVFYTFDGNVRDICDITWNIRTREFKYLEIVTKIFKPNDSHTYVRNLSRKLKTIISDIPIPRTATSVPDYLEHVDIRLTGNLDTRTFDNNFHVLLVYNKDSLGKEFYTIIPVVGMNHLDAERKYTASYSDILEDFVQHDKILLREQTPSPDKMMGLIISEIQENESDINKNKLPSKTYALGELLFSYFVMQEEGWVNLTTHDIIMFRPADEDPEKFDTFIISMDEVALEIFK